MEDEVMIALEVRSGAEIDISGWIEEAAKNLAAFAVPRFVRVVDALPKTPTGKIRKVVLREEGVTKGTFEVNKTNYKSS